MSSTAISEFFKRIIVPIDFSDAGQDEIGSADALVIEAGEHRVVFAWPSIRALELATALGRVHRSTLRLVHATPPLQTSSVYAGPVSIPSAILQEIHDRARTTSIDVLQQIVHRYCEKVEVELAVRPGHPMDVVLDEAKHFSADLIVMAASGRSRVTRFFVGSTADRIIRRAGCPVMVVPADGRG